MCHDDVNGIRGTLAAALLACMAGAVCLAAGAERFQLPQLQSAATAIAGILSARMR